MIAARSTAPLIISEIAVVWLGCVDAPWLISAYELDGDRLRNGSRLIAQ